MADADDSYDLKNLDPFYKNLEKGYQLVMGNRFGVRFLSSVGRIVSKCKVYDFHCGIRGLETKKIQELNLREPGMEFASEMIVEASRKKLKICEIISLYR